MQRRNKMLAWIFLVIYVLASSFGMVLIKKGGADTNMIFSKENFHIQISWNLLFGVIFYLFSFILWMFLLQMFNLTYISPVAYGMVYISIMVLSKIFLSEIISKWQIIGVIMIIAGIFIASIKTS